MDSKVYKVNAFTHKGGGGNPAGLLILDRDLEDDEMLKIAKDVNFSETAFIRPLDKDNFKVRFFTPLCEVDLCGHATIGSFYVLSKLGFIKPKSSNIRTIYQETKAGRLMVQVYFENKEVTKVFMEQSQGKSLGLIEELGDLALAMGINKEDIGLDDKFISPEIITTGLADIILPLRSKKILDGLRIKREKLIELTKELNVGGVHAFYLEDGKDTAYTRNFAPLLGIDEEAATGTSNGALLHYLNKHSLLKSKSLLAYQGETMNRLSEIHCKIEEVNKKDIIKVGGYAKLFE